MVANTWLRLADYTPNFIEDKDCLRLAELHSAAVDYPKSGIPVPITGLPKTPKIKPDWSAPETVQAENAADFYPSQRALGQLFRDIKLSGPKANKARRKAPHEGEDDIDLGDLDSAMSSLSLSASHSDQDPVSRALLTQLLEFYDEDELQDVSDADWARQIFSTYAQELSFIRRNHTLSSKRGSRLSEEEVLVGTIVAKTSQPRKRKDLMSQMRDRTNVLVSQLKEDIGGKDIPLLRHVQRGWMAWKLSRFLADRGTDGAESFGIIAIGSILDAVTALENVS